MKKRGINKKSGQSILYVKRQRMPKWSLPKPCQNTVFVNKFDINNATSLVLSCMTFVSQNNIFAFSNVSISLFHCYGSWIKASQYFIESVIFKNSF